jgi:deoxycytidylate deaminase
MDNKEIVELLLQIQRLSNSFKMKVSSVLLSNNSGIKSIGINRHIDGICEVEEFKDYWEDGKLYKISNFGYSIPTYSGKNKFIDIQAFVFLSLPFEVKKSQPFGLTPQDIISGFPNSYRLQTKHDTLHAEADCLNNYHGEVEDSDTLYISHSPCINCAGLIKDKGIKNIKYLKFHKEGGILYLNKHQITIEKIS